MAIVTKKQDTWLDPFKERENAIAALRDCINEKNEVSRQGRYCLEIINQLAQNGTHLLKRLPQEVFCGCPEGGRRHVEASALCRAENGTEPTKQDAVRESGYTRTQEIIGQWAERDGCWSDNTDSDQLNRGRSHDPLIDGSEARVYFDESTGYVYKTIDVSHYLSMSLFLDRISIHNAIFPETALSVEGFGIRDDATSSNDFVAVVKQPFVKGTAPSSDELEAEVKRQMKEKGFDCPEDMAGWFYVSESGNLMITDMTDLNCVISPEGNLLVFDCEAYLNINPQLKGKYTIPKLDYDSDKVAYIEMILTSYAPQVVPKTNLRSYLHVNDLKQAESEMKAYGQTITPIDNGSDVTFTLAENPDKPDTVLVMRSSSTKEMLRYHNGKTDEGIQLSKEDMKMLSGGQAVKKGNTVYIFNIDKGRIDTLPRGMRLYLQKQAVNKPKLMKL